MTFVCAQGITKAPKHLTVKACRRARREGVHYTHFRVPLMQLLKICTYGLHERSSFIVTRKLSEAMIDGIDQSLLVRCLPPFAASPSRGKSCSARKSCVFIYEAAHLTLDHAQGCPMLAPST